MRRWLAVLTAVAVLLFLGVAVDTEAGSKWKKKDWKDKKYQQWKKKKMKDDDSSDDDSSDDSSSDDPVEQEEQIELSAAEILIEINATDGDAGIQLFLDGEGWDEMEVRNPNGDSILDFAGEGGVGQQGITELFFESAEPSFDEQPLEDLLALFPAGVYEFEGKTTDGVKLVGEATLSHALPEGPFLVSPIEGASVDPDDTVLQWQLVSDPAGSTIVGYEVIVVREEPTKREFKADVSNTTTSITVPPEFMEPGTTYKWEVLAIEASGNQTLSETEFETD